VAQAIVEGDPESGGAQLQIRARRFDSQTPTTRLLTLRQQAEETLPELLGRGAAVLDHEIQEAWKQQNLVRPGSEATITISVPVRRLDDWLEVRRRLAEVGPIQQTSVTALSTNRALIEVSFVGDENQLDVALAQNDLDLSLGPSGWELRLAGAPAGRPVGEPSGTMPMESGASDSGGAAATGDMPAEQMSPGQLPQGQTGPAASAP
ncbi:MAG TPA: hypothetical protein VLL72_00110, partial [Kiloniellales bacterium]|nr:hypothetical protein [Kiloniellales bacterium]